jgi:hypothetical protein
MFLDERITAPRLFGTAFILTAIGQLAFSDAQRGYDEAGSNRTLGEWSSCGCAPAEKGTINVGHPISAD